MSGRRRHRKKDGRLGIARAMSGIKRALTEKELEEWRQMTDEEYDFFTAGMPEDPNKTPEEGP